MPIGTGRSYLSLGGEVRYQYFRYQNADWGQQAPDPDGFVLSRLLNHADLHLNDRFRLFAQIQSSLMAGSDDPNSPIDENPLDLHQLFFDYTLHNSSGNKLLFRAGRQELSYGSQRLVSVREMPNNRQAFDALRFIFSKDRFRTDAFYSTYVNAKSKIFDEPFCDMSSQFWGSYFVMEQPGILPDIDGYYLGLRKRHASFDDGSGKETRHSFGTRLWKKTGQIDYDLEAVYQTGTLDKQAIRAWTVSLHAAYQFEHTTLKPVVGLKTELISGDRNYGDWQINTFNPLYPRGAYFGLASLIGPYNLQDLHPYLALKLSKQLTWSTDYDIFWRMRRHEGLYAVNGRLIHTGRDIGGKAIGNQLGTDLSLQANPFLYLRAELSWFKPRTFLYETGLGKHIVMVAVTATVRY